MIVDKVLGWIERTRSRIYGIFIFWLSVGFSPVIFTSFFTDQQLIFQKTGLLKDEYIRHEFFNGWNGFAYITGVISISVLITFLMIWFFPTWFVNKAYEKEIEAHYIREKKRLDEKDKLENKRKALAKKQLEVIEQEEEVAKREDDLLDREQSDWQNEYEEFKASMLFEKFSWVVKAIFEHYGYIVVKDYNSNITFKVPNDILAYSQGAELIDIDIREGSIALTKKGNYFLKKYQLENQ